MTKVVMAGGGTGGHLFPAIAIANAVQQLEPDWSIAYAGALRGVEARVLPERGLEHRLFPFEPVHRQQWWRNFRWPLLARRVIREVDSWLAEVNPDVVVGTGGYVSGPVIWRASRLGIPTAILELDVLPGLATKLASRYAGQIWLAAPEARHKLPTSAQSRAVEVGAPITPPDRLRRAEALSRLGLNSEEPVVVITGGSQGSLAINRVIAEWLTSGFGTGRQVIWATGRRSHTDFAELQQLPAVHVIEFIDPMADAWAVADLVVCRAGMMTLSELAAWGLPAIVVPLPTSAADHQTHNSHAAAEAGASIHMPQSELSVQSLEATIDGLLSSPEKLGAMAAASRSRGRPEAATELARRVISLAGS